MNYPTLFKKTSNGAIEQWSVWTEDADIVTEWGRVSGKMQTSRETATGKSLGKKNETTPKQQAESQAQSEWTMKKSRKGYVEDLAKAEAGENDGAGGIRPMLAKSFDDHADKLVYPCAVQPKLDGIRCIATVEASGNVSLWSREQKPITAVPHINAAVETLGLPPGTVLDGELYSDDYKDDFEKIVSAVRKQSPDPAFSDIVQYHIYDMPRHPDLRLYGWHFIARNSQLCGILTSKPVPDCIRFVHTRLAFDEAHLIECRTDYQKAGYEGAMARNTGSPYEEGKRSSNLLKLKEFLEEEFEIMDVEEGVGKMAGLAVFVCKTPDGTEFRCKMEGELEGLRKYVQDETTWKGKKLTVKFFSYTNKSKVPRFGVGKAVRDYE